MRRLWSSSPPPHSFALTAAALTRAHRRRTHSCSPPSSQLDRLFRPSSFSDAILCRSASGRPCRCQAQNTHLIDSAMPRSLPFRVAESVPEKSNPSTQPTHSSACPTFLTQVGDSNAHLVLPNCSKEYSIPPASNDACSRPTSKGAAHSVPQTGSRSHRMH